MPPRCLQHFIGGVSSLRVALHGGQGQHLHHAALTSVFQKAEPLSAGHCVECKRGQWEKSKEFLWERNLYQSWYIFTPKKKKLSGLVLVVTGWLERFLSWFLVTNSCKRFFKCHEVAINLFCEHYQFSTTKDPSKSLLLWPVGFNSINCGQALK